MKTLIIHPKDKSTDFLSSIYKNIEDKTLVTENTKRNDLRNLIETHDRILMLGHGTPSGLLSVGKFEYPYVIDHTFVDLLSNKNNSIFIWCNADRFVNRYNLKGFYSGMFVSEVSEAYFCKLGVVDRSIVEMSNNTFSEILGSIINEDTEMIYNHVKDKYGEFSRNNLIGEYNNDRLYIS